MWRATFISVLNMQNDAVVSEVDMHFSGTLAVNKSELCDHDKGSNKVGK